MADPVGSIRNICLAGPAGAGKTTLLEALLVRAKVVNAAGDVANGTTVSDADPAEKAIGHSLDSTLCSFADAGLHLNIIDTPGHPDLVGRAFAVLPAADTAAIVINAQSGVDAVADMLMAEAKRRRLCRLLVVNRIDHPDADPAAVFTAIQERYGPECLPLNVPLDRGRAVADCFFDPSASGSSDIGDIEAAHTRIVEQVVELSEELMDLYLEQGETVTPEQLHEPFEQALREGHLVPVVFVSATEGTGIDYLLRVFEDLMPSPEEGNPPEFLKGASERVTVVHDDDAHAIAHVFKVSVDPFRGRLAYIRIHQGTLTNHGHVYIGDARKPFKMSHLLRVLGTKHEELTEAGPGDICAIPRAEGMHYDAVVHDSHDEDEFHLRRIALPEPMFAHAIAPVKETEAQKLSDALHALRDEDPSIDIEHIATFNETVLKCMGELHMKTVLERMRSHYNVDVTTSEPSIPYRETITLAAEGHHRHKKQTGGAGQFGEVFLRIEPLPRGSGVEFVNAITGGVIPSQFIPAVEKGIKQAEAEGAIAGYPVRDVRVTVYDGKTHPVDSKEVAFVTAGRKAFLDAVSKARAIVLEPIVNVTITAPAETMGDLTGELSRLRGAITGTDSDGNGKVRIIAQAPLAEMQSFHQRLKSLTGGEGAFTLAPAHYAQVPANVQKDLEGRFKRHEDD